MKMEDLPIEVQERARRVIKLSMQTGYTLVGIFAVLLVFVVTGYLPLLYTMAAAALVSLVVVQVFQRFWFCPMIREIDRAKKNG